MGPETLELVQQAADGNEGAWSALVDRFAGLIWSIARARGLSDADAADVSQTTWLRFAENLGRLRDPSSAASWLATTARHEVIRVSRLASRDVLVDPWEEFDAASTDGEVDAELLAEERGLAVQEAVGLLPCRCRELLQMLSADPPVAYASISDLLEMPVGSIGPSRSRCLARLRTLIDEVEGRRPAPVPERASS